LREFFKPWGTKNELKKSDPFIESDSFFVATAYCWQVALQQSLLPLWLYGTKINEENYYLCEKE
jgi:hypothetical protein